METIFVNKVKDFFSKEIKDSFSGFREVNFSSNEVSLYNIPPIFLAKCNVGSADLFFSAIPIKGSLAQLTVECGWKTTESEAYPIACDEFNYIYDNNYSALSEKDNFAIRLFRLCTGRGSIEYFWSLYANSIWNNDVESVKNYAERNRNELIDNVLDFDYLDGPSNDFVDKQVNLICPDIVACLENYGLPFLFANKYER